MDYTKSVNLQPARSKRILVVGAIALVLAFSAEQAPAQQLVQTGASSAENFDIRTDQEPASNAYMERFSARPSFAGVAAVLGRRAAGVTRLRAAVDVDLIDSPELGTTEVVSAKPGAGFLTQPATNRVAAMRAFLSTHADVYGLSQDQIRDLVVVADYANPSGNMAWVEFEQHINGLPVFRGLIRGGFTARGELTRTTGPVAAGLDPRSLPVLPALAAAAAVSRAAGHVGWDVPAAVLREKSSAGGRITLERGPMADDAKAWLLYFPLAPGVARLAWCVEIWGNPDVFMMVLDAQDGTLLFRKNLTENELAEAAPTEGGIFLAQQQTPPIVNVPSPSVVSFTPADASATLDFVARRAYMRTATGGAGNVVDIPAIGQTVFFYLDLQIYGTGDPLTLVARARLDGVDRCTVSGTVAPGQTLTGNCNAGWVALAGEHTLLWEIDHTGSVSEMDETNNAASKTFTPSTSTFDLVGQRAYLRTALSGGGTEVLDQPTVGETVFFHFDFQITGTGGPVLTGFRAVLDGAPFCSFSFSVAPQASFFTWCATGWVVTPGPHTLLWELDFDALQSEKDETNNTTLKTFNPASTTGTQPATYYVYLDDSPAPLSPTTTLPGTGTQAPFISRTPVTLIGNEAPNTFNNLGWMKDGANVTDGNNVQAGIDRDFVDGVDAVVTGASRVFNFSYNPQTDNPLTPTYQNGEVTDMFYWTNVYHDKLYGLGFTEAAGNFQNDNFGRGGLGGDRVRAEAQDYSGLVNANFSTPTDGGRGRMQMYIFSGPVPPRTSALEHDVLLHELTHGTSNRLHNNSSGLTSVMARGMGEGWSDFYARALLSSGSEDQNGIYSTGGWVTHLLVAGYTDNYYYGIRRFPYAVKNTVGANGKPHNPLTFADLDSAQIDTTDGAYPRSPISGNSALQVHNIGEIWCMALLEVRARYITRLGWAVGNQRFLQFVTDGMKLDPVNPTLLQGRDSIIAAANSGAGTPSDIIDIWAGFATRGMGVSAQVIDAINGTVVEAFDLPASAAKRRGQLISD